jgi:hypothetical protein
MTTGLAMRAIAPWTRAARANHKLNQLVKVLGRADDGSA